jgi:hypothetical protein
MTHSAELKKHMISPKKKKKPSMLEATASSSLFSCDNWVSSCKEFFLECVFLSGDRLSVFQKAYSAELKKHMYLSKDNHLS